MLLQKTCFHIQRSSGAGQVILTNSFNMSQALSGRTRLTCQEQSRTSWFGQTNVATAAQQGLCPSSEVSAIEASGPLMHGRGVNEMRSNDCAHATYMHARDALDRCKHMPCLSHLSFRCAESIRTPPVHFGSVKCSQYRCRADAPEVPYTHELERRQQRTVGLSKGVVCGRGGQSAPGRSGTEDRRGRCCLCLSAYRVCVVVWQPSQASCQPLGCSVWNENERTDRCGTCK